MIKAPLSRIAERWSRWRAERVLARRAIPEPIWLETLARYPFLAARPGEDLQALRRMVSLFLDQKEFTGAHGLVVTDAMAVAVAAQACLPVLELGLHLYGAMIGIVMQPGQAVARREEMDDDGIVHRYDEVLAGEAMERGPVMLAWTEVADAGQSAEYGYNVVIHEFMHVLDLVNGAADGMPPLPDARARQAWAEVMTGEYERFCRRVDEGGDTALDPYGAESIDEFFPVAAEAFFVSPEAMAEEHPALYRLFADYFRQDPLAQARAAARL